MLWHKLPKSIYLCRGSLPTALGEVTTNGHKRALIVTDRSLFNSGYADRITSVLRTAGVETGAFFEVEADPALIIIYKGADLANSFKPDAITTLGGDSPMDAAKIMWVMYEHPKTHFEELVLRFVDIRKRIYKFPKVGAKAKMVAITITSGIGSEVTPFTMMVDNATGQKYPLIDYILTLDMATVGASLAIDMLKSLCVFGGLDTVTRTLEAYVSVLASEFSDGQALQALKLLREYLSVSYREGSKNPIAHERVHSAAAIADIASTNAFLGVCHSVAHKLGSRFRIPHGLASTLLICNVIRYNANDSPTKQTALSQYDRSQARRRYVEIADHLSLSAPGGHTAAKIEKLLAWLKSIKAELGVPKLIRETGAQEVDFLISVGGLSEDAFDDQCIGANPRYPLISELKQILLDTYYGREFAEDETAVKADAASVKARRRVKKPT